MFDLAVESWELSYHLGQELRAASQPAAALVYYTEAILLEPRRPEVHAAIGAALQDLLRFDEAAASYARALKLAPECAAYHYDLAKVQLRRGRMPEAQYHFRQARTLDLGHDQARSGLVTAMLYTDCDPHDVLAESRAWAARHASFDTVAHPNDPDPERPLRVGYVTNSIGAFRPVGLFLRPVLEGHHRDRFAVTCYIAEKSERNAGPLPSARVCRRFVGDLSDDALARRIRRDRIDILVDAGGHFAGGRLPVFGRKPAPVQVSYLAYPATTGVPAIDYRITDAVADPPGRTESFHSEELVRLPGVFLCYQPPVKTPPVGELPLLRAGKVTFGCCNRLSKINPEVLGAWARILRQVRGSRLIIHHQWGVGEDNRESVRELRRIFKSHGILSERVRMVGLLPAAEHLRLYASIDVALDTFPYSGTTTTCEALWMGVPVITRAGRAHVSRVGATLLSSVGLSEYVTHSQDDYVAAAVTLARDTARLRDLRAGLRARMRHSPLMDSAGFMRGLEAAYRRMWRRWCKK